MPVHLESCGVKNLPSDGFYFRCDMNRGHALRGKRKWVNREFEDYRKDMRVNGTNKCLDQKFLTWIQRTPRKSVGELQTL